jgi:transporter family-2 protein
MVSAPFLIAVAVIAGIAVALQGQFMGTLDRTLGSAASVLITYGVGGVIATLLWLMRRESLARAREVPWYAWFAGALGLVIVGGIGYASPRLGLSRTIVITIAAQLLAAIVIDHFGLFAAPQRTADAWRVVGLALTIGGAFLIVK